MEMRIRFFLLERSGQHISLRELLISWCTIAPGKLLNVLKRLWPENLNTALIELVHSSTSLNFSFLSNSDFAKGRSGMRFIKQSFLSNQLMQDNHFLIYSPSVF